MFGSILFYFLFSRGWTLLAALGGATSMYVSLDGFGEKERSIRGSVSDFFILRFLGRSPFVERLHQYDALLFADLPTCLCDASRVPPQLFRKKK